MGAHGILKIPLVVLRLVWFVAYSYRAEQSILLLVHIDIIIAINDPHYLSRSDWLYPSVPVPGPSMPDWSEAP